jgi:predicted metal-dependent phosphoesterase TrpH
LIDLHMHTTASDGMLSPTALVDAAAAAGLTTISVTDHDTVAGLAEARAAAERHGLTFIDGIELTAVEQERDVHVLGYGFDPADSGLAAFLKRQREDRVRRVRAITERLAAAGARIDPEPILRLALVEGRSVGRPHVAAALVAAGHVQTSNEAFDRYLGRGCPGFVARVGASAADVVRSVRAAGGWCSLAHPGLTRMDELIPGLAAAGLTALEARHSDHDPSTEEKYRRMAATLGLLVTGGSDFHGDPSHDRGGLGSVTLPAADFRLLMPARR